MKFDNHYLKIKYDLHKISGKVSFIVDIWTSMISSKTYLGLMIYYIDQNQVLQQFLLDIILFKIHYTKVNIANAINNVFNEFNLTNKALVLITDNEFTMIMCG